MLQPALKRTINTFGIQSEGRKDGLGVRALGALSFDNLTLLTITIGFPLALLATPRWANENFSGPSNVRPTVFHFCTSNLAKDAASDWRAASLGKVNRN